jgi:two-component system NtrC family sensor kinase
LHVDLPPASSDELGDLTRDFATMVAQLQDARHRLEQSAAGLADEVKRQTAHLEQALADLRTSQGQLAAAERLAALGTLAGGVAHEFRNVIGGIRGCANELLAEAADADQRETLAVITRAADRGSGIVQQLLRFARPAVERTTTVDPSTVVADALRLCEPAARQQQIQVERDLPPGPAVALDADGVHQVCVNLMLNALAAMTAGGTLRVMVQHHDDHTAIAIADTGCGIAAADLPHLFEPFFTTRGTAVDPARRGTGLGLSVSHGIVRGHGGRIEVQSAPGVGSTFTVRLPRQH